MWSPRDALTRFVLTLALRPCQHRRPRLHNEPLDRCWLPAVQVTATAASAPSLLAVAAAANVAAGSEITFAICGGATTISQGPMIKQEYLYILYTL